MDSEVDEPNGVSSRFLGWSQWQMTSRGVAFLGIIASLWQLQGRVVLGVLISLHLGLIALSQRPSLEPEEPRGSRVDAHLLVISLVFMLNTSFATYALSFAPLGAFAVAAALLLSPAQRHLILMMLIFTLELGWTLKHASSVHEASSHAVIYGAGLGLMLWLVKQVRGGSLTEALHESRSAHYVSATLYELPSNEGPQPTPSGVQKSFVAEADVTVQELSAPRFSQERPGDDSPPMNDQSAQEERRVDEPTGRPALSSDDPQEALPASSTPYYGSSVSGEHDLGLATRQVRPFSPPDQLDHIRQHALEQRKRPLEFLDLSCAIVLGHLAEQLRADSAVLVWRRNKSGGKEAAVRWR